MLPRGSRIICMMYVQQQLVFAGMDLCCTNPAQPLATAGDELDRLDHDLPARGTQYSCAAVAGI